MSTPLIFSIDGNIGSGKTTLLHKLGEAFPDYEIIDEPVGDWLALKGTDGRSLLETFYTDKTRWGYSFQTMAFITRFLNISRALDKCGGAVGTNPRPKIFITERSVLTDKHVFAKMLHEEGALNDLEWAMQNMWFDALSAQLQHRISGVIYVDTLPNVCADRIKCRGREGEDGIPLDYLLNLDRAHREWLSSEKRIPVLNVTSDDCEIPRIRKWIEEQA